MYSTDQRNSILEFFDNNPDKLFSAQEILDALEDKGISRSTLYRNLLQLEKSHKIKKYVKQGSKTTYYRYLHGSECKGKIHLHCTKCENTFHMKEMEASAIVDSISKNDEFMVDKTSSIIYGTCKSCQEL